MKTTGKQYDIFISYRRNGGAQYARILQLMLQQRGYRVFLDYDELTDGIFGDHIRESINNAPVFLLVLSDGALERCVNEDDWVRQEILLALKLDKHIVPVNPDNSFSGVLQKGVPDEICALAKTHQQSEILFGQTLGVTVDYMIEKRIAPKIGVRSNAKHIDTDFDAAKETLRKMEAHQRFMKRLGVVSAALLLAVVIAIGLLLWAKSKERDHLTDLRTEVEQTYSQFNLKLQPTLSERQIDAVREILAAMAEVRKDSLYLSRFEFTQGLWHGVLGQPCEETLYHLPKTDVSFADIELFLDTLRTLTGAEHAAFDFSLPSAEEWEYAARGGRRAQQTTYAGSNDADAVAWYAGNSDGILHASDGQQGKECNTIDLFDMSGNVGEWCNTPFEIVEGEARWTVCGGDYTSSASEVKVNSRKGVDINTKAPTIGFRLALRREGVE